MQNCNIWKDKKKKRGTDQRRKLATLKQKYCYLAQIKVDEVLCFVRNVWPEVSSNNTVPCRVVLLVKFFLYIRCYILLDIVPKRLLNVGRKDYDMKQIHSIIQRSKTKSLKRYFVHNRHYQQPLFRENYFKVLCFMLHFNTAMYVKELSIARPILWWWEEH